MPFFRPPKLGRKNGQQLIRSRTGLTDQQQAALYYKRHRRGPPPAPPPPVGEVCLTNQYRSSDGFCFFTTTGEPLVFGIQPPDPTTNQYATIGDNVLLETTLGEPLMYGIH